MNDVKIQKINRRNISRRHQFTSSVLDFLNKGTALKQILMYRRTYRNHVNIIIDSLRKKYPIKAILKNGNVITLRNGFETYMLSQCGGNLYDYNNEMLTLSLPYTEKRVKLYGVNVDSEAISLLVDSPYKDLPVKDKVVVDVGANIGDSPIYFALRGATKVIGLEPIPKNYELAIKNIELNGLSKKITMLQAGCTDNVGFIAVDPEQESSAITRLQEVKNGTKIPLLTLGEILDQNNIQREAVLKMDCEGCEYEALLSAPENILKRFSHMLVEYHYGYKNIVEKLEQIGFNVSVTRPNLSKDENSMQFGYILLELN